jgi:hypothetical protein
MTWLEKYLSLKLYLLYQGGLDKRRGKGTGAGYLKCPVRKPVIWWYGKYDEGLPCHLYIQDDLRDFQALKDR